MDLHHGYTMYAELAHLDLGLDLSLPFPRKKALKSVCFSGLPII
jgi:hypothetical protein